ncbi:MAG: GerAB/ArcD/ProY family transporter [Bacilli bacterium]
MIENKINSLQLAALLLMIMLSSFLGIGFFASIKAAGINAYLSVILGTILGLFILGMFLIIFNYKPNLSLPKKIINLFGLKIGLIINIIIFILTFFMGLSAMFNLTNFIGSQFLPETPLFLIGFIFSLLIIIINYKGIEVISRVCIILIGINLLLYFLATLGLIPSFKLSNLQPFLEDGVYRPLYGSIFILEINILPIFLLLMISKNSIVDKAKTSKYLLTFYLFGALLMFFTMFLSLGVLGIDLASIYQYPEYIVLKNINLLQFIDRIENVITIQWIFGLFIFLSIIVYFLSNYLKVNNKHSIIYVIITFAILITCFLLFANNTIFNSYIYKYILYIRSAFLLIFLFISMAIIYKCGFKKNLFFTSN